MGYLTGGHIWLLAILLIIVLIIWGPGKLPDVGSGLGRAIREFRKASSETRDEFTRAARGDETTPAPATRRDAQDVRSAEPQPGRADDPLTPRDPTAPEVPVTSGPGAPISPAPLGGGTVLGPPPDSDPR
jgi:TatA/E family protein of Tat protein translocase